MIYYSIQIYTNKKYYDIYYFIKNIGKNINKQFKHKLWDIITYYNVLNHHPEFYKIVEKFQFCRCLCEFLCELLC